MILFHMSDGTYKEAPGDFDTEKPDMDRLEGVEEVLVVGKVLVKQVRLVPKSREERAQIRASMSKTETPAGKPQKRKRVA